MAVDRSHLKGLLQDETERFMVANPRSLALFREACGSLLGGVPMTWMSKWVGSHPLFAARAGGAWVEDVDGHRYVDFALGDTGAMAGHSPAPVVDAVARRLGEVGGANVMLATEDAAWLGDVMASGFILHLASLCLTAPDTN